MKAFTRLVMKATAVATLSVPVAASGQGGGLRQLAPFASLCIEEKAAGFDWQKGDWVPAHFAGEKFIVQKIPQKNFDGTGTPYHPFCRVQEAANSGLSRLEFGCYNIRKAGTELIPLTSQMCTEFWIGNEIRQINCNNTVGLSRAYYFLPDGNFILYPTTASTNVDAKPERDYKDSLVLSVGKCSVVSGSEP